MDDLVLIADDDRDIVRFVEVNLRLEGFDVITANDGEEALHKALTQQPKLILLDVMMPRMDGYEVCSRLRADSRTAHIPVIMLTAKSLSADKVHGLTVGADDYIVKPFDPMELIARVKSTLQRVEERQTRSPLTGLPGNQRIEQEIQRRMEQRVPIAVVYADLDHFKAYNDRYGSFRGDQVISLTAQVLRTTAEEVGGPQAFVGYAGGDDFVVVVPPHTADAFAARAIYRFNQRIPTLYDPQDARAGFIEVPDFHGIPRRFPILSISLGIAANVWRPFRSAREIIAFATELKNAAKRQPGSSYLVDRHPRPY